MTRSQVRAATRRMRDHVEDIEEEAGELNLVPYMDIVTNIIIFLLASVVNQVALGNINVSSPTLQAGSRSPSDEPPPEKPPLHLTITVRATAHIVGPTAAAVHRRAGKQATRTHARELAERGVVKGLGSAPVLDMMTLTLALLRRSFSWPTGSITFDEIVQGLEAFAALEPKLAVPVTGA